MRAIFIILFFSAHIAGMDQAIENNADKLLQKLFNAIAGYKYEKSADLILKNPELVDMRGRYGKEFYIHDGYTSLHVAASVGNYIALAQLLDVSKESVNAQASLGFYTPLHCATNEKVARLLIEHGAILDQKDKYRDTPLSSALSFCGWKPNFEVANCLVQCGANINATNKYGDTLLHQACSEHTYSFTFFEDATFLLEHGANPDIAGKTLQTPFDQVMDHEQKKELFSNHGFLYYSPYDDLLYSNEDNIELFKSNPQKFLETKGFKKRPYFSEAFQTVLNLYRIARLQERGKYSFLRSDTSLPITIKKKKHHIVYIFKRPSFADLESFFGKDAIDCLKEYCSNAFNKIKEFIESNTYITKFKFSTRHLLNEVNALGDSLLHIAVRARNKRAIELLMLYRVDCLVKNHAKELAFDYITDSSDECLQAFIQPLIDRFFRKSLDKETEAFVLNHIIWGKDDCLRNNMYVFFRILRERPDTCLFFLEKGININHIELDEVETYLSATLKPHFKEPWKKIPSETKYLIRLLLENGAIVTQEMINQSSGYTKKLLQNYYNKQEERLHDH